MNFCGSGITGIHFNVRNSRIERTEYAGALCRDSKTMTLISTL